MTSPAKETPSRAARCALHRGAAAGWECSQCHLLLCPDCVIRIEIRQHYRETSVDACTACNGFAQVLFVPGATAGLGVQLVRALRVPVTGYGLGAGLAILGVLRQSRHLTGAPLAAVFLFLVAPVFWPLFFVAIRGAWAATGSGESGLDLQAHVVRPSLRACVLTAAAVGIGVAVGGAQAGILADHGGLVLWTAILLLGWCAPAILVGLAGDEGLLASISPARIARRLRETGPDYALAGLATCGVAFFSAWWNGAARLGRAAHIPLLPTLLDAASLYSWFVVARVVGLLLGVHGDSLGYGLPPGAQVQALPDAVPRGRRKA